MTKGIIAGCFDIIHPGYILMFEDAKNVCDYLIIALQSDPTIDRPEKNKTVQTLQERIIILNAIKHIDEIIKEVDEQKQILILKKIYTNC